MNRNNLQTARHQAADSARSLGRRIAQGAVAVGATVTAMAASAATSLGSTAATAIDGAGSEVSLVQTAVIGVLVLLVIFLFIKRSMK